ncbi:MAG: hypothetical protein ACOYOK_09010 [Pseudobdellovibrionaceae bacterium]
MHPSFSKTFPIVVGLCIQMLWLPVYAQTPAPTAVAAPQNSKVELDRSLKPSTTDEISTLFENVVAVQRKAKIKSGKYIISPYLSFDFSDSPYTMYGLNLNFGYAASEFWEFYLNYVPVYVSNERGIAKKVKDLGLLQSGLQPEISMEKAKSSYGFEVNWVPIYGKDSWGPYGIIRSDTFLNFGATQMKYASGDGLKVKIALGKTFFVRDGINLRLQAGGASVQTITQGKKEAVFIGLLEGGLVYYF